MEAYLFARVENSCGTSVKDVLQEGMVRPAGFKPATSDLEGRCSIHLSYGRSLGPYTKPSTYGLGLS